MQLGSTTSYRRIFTHSTGGAPRVTNISLVPTSIFPKRNKLTFNSFVNIKTIKKLVKRGTHSDLKKILNSSLTKKEFEKILLL